MRKSVRDCKCGSGEGQGVERVGWPVDSDVIYLVCDQRSASKVRPDLWLHLVGISWLDQGEMERGATER